MKSLREKIPVWKNKYFKFFGALGKKSSKFGENFRGGLQKLKPTGLEEVLRKILIF